VVPPPLCPDLGLLVVLSIGLRWRGLPLGLALASALGFAADLLSGSLLGQHALLRLVAFASAFLAGRQLNLKGSLPLVVFAGSVSVAYGLAVYAVSGFFAAASGAATPGAGWLLESVWHAAVNGAFAPGVFGVVSRVAARTGAEDALSRTLRIDPRRRPA
jgi:cell shape-determining protein MreD